MAAILTQIRAAVIRRRAQTVTVLLISLLAGSVATMALTLLVRSSQPWDDAFAKYSGAHLIFTFDGGKVSAAQLAATASLPGVTAAGPVQETVQLGFGRSGQKGNLLLIGRTNPGGAIDRIPLVAGRWPAHQGEIVVTRTQDTSIPLRPVTGETISALTSAGVVSFKVVGEAIELGGHASVVNFVNAAAPAWVLPADVEALVSKQSPLGYEMAYRFQHAGTQAELDADRHMIDAALPPGSETGTAADWMRMRAGSLWLVVLVSGILFAFTAFALLAVTLITGSVVAGSVLAGFREIGISKALGFTPLDVLAVYVGQMAVPALVGAVAGIPFGVLLSRPFLDSIAASVQLPEPAIFDPVVAISVPLGVVALVIVAALVPALRAASADSTRAIAMGSAPPAGRRSRLSVALASLGFPRPVSIGAGDAFARPVRALLTLTALSIGIATATFAIGFQTTLVRLLTQEPAAYGYAQNVTVIRYPGLADQSLSATLAADSETQTVVAQRQLFARLPGLKDPVDIFAFRGDPTALGYHAIRGRWFSGAGEAVIAGNVASEAKLGLGDGLRVPLGDGSSLDLRVVGFYNDFNTSGRSIAVDWSTLAAAQPESTPNEYLIKLRPGGDAGAYAKRVGSSAPDYVDAKATTLSDVNFYSNALAFLVGGLALVLMAIAALGVFNATRLSTRERVFDLAVFKALGMTGRQTALMVVSSTLVLATLGTVVGVPLGSWLEGVMWDTLLASFGFVVSSTSAGNPVSVALAVAAAFGLALLGAWLPARWAAASPVAQVLRSE